MSSERITKSAQLARRDRIPSLILKFRVGRAHGVCLNGFFHRQPLLGHPAVRISCRRVSPASPRHRAPHLAQRSDDQSVPKASRTPLSTKVRNAWLRLMRSGPMRVSAQRPSSIRVVGCIGAITPQPRIGAQSLLPAMCCGMLDAPAPVTLAVGLLNLGKHVQSHGIARSPRHEHKAVIRQRLRHEGAVCMAETGSFRPLKRPCLIRRICYALKKVCCLRTHDPSA